MEFVYCDSSQRLSINSNYYRPSNYFSFSVLESTVLLEWAVISLLLRTVGKYFELRCTFNTKKFMVLFRLIANRDPNASAHLMRLDKAHEDQKNGS